MTYSQEEVQDLIDRVFKLSAKDIDDKIKKVMNRPEIAKRRWFWELLQNAKDAVGSNDKVAAKLILGNDYNTGKPFIDFKHNGKPFSYKDVENLIFPYSDKADELNSDKSGRFGTGFLATHILSKEINVDGVYHKDNEYFKFNFNLNRTGIDKPQIAIGINDTWQEFRKNKTQIPEFSYNQNNYDTTFRYYLDEASFNLVLASLKEIDHILPYVLTFVSKIEKVEVINAFDGSTVLYNLGKKQQLEDSIWHYQIEKVKTIDLVPETSKINLIVSSDIVMDVAIEVFKSNDQIYIKPATDSRPILYCSFPLIGASGLKFPLVVNCSNFKPKEERDGIWLDDVGYGLTNQQLFERVIPLYINICMYASKSKWLNTYLLLKSLNKEFVFQDFNTTWFKERIQDALKKRVFQVPLVDLLDGRRVAPGEVHFISGENEENRIQLWNYVSAAFPNKVPLKQEVNDWYDVIWNEFPRWTFDSYSKWIASLQKVEVLGKKIQKDAEKTIEWLDNYLTYLLHVQPNILNTNELKILPNQLGEFKQKDELYYDDGTIHQELKEILAMTAQFTSKVHDWRSDMLDRNIFVALPENRLRNIEQIGIIISENVKDILKADSPNNEMRELFSRLLAWMNENPKDSSSFFKEVRADALLYKCTEESKLRKFTEILKLDRDGVMQVDDQLTILKDPRTYLLKDPDLEMKVRLGSEVMANMQKEKMEFEFKKRTGDIFEKVFEKMMLTIPFLRIQKVEGEEDFIISNELSNKEYYIEIKSFIQGETRISMTHRQAKKAAVHPGNYFLCLIPNDGTNIDEDYIKKHARFDPIIGEKLSKKVEAAIKFETPEPGISVTFEDELLRNYSKYRYKFLIEQDIWGHDTLDSFLSKLS